MLSTAALRLRHLRLAPAAAQISARREVSAGDAILFDYRLFHAGGANHSTERRPILYLIYARSWFDDTFNFPAKDEASIQNELDMGGVDRAALELPA